MSENLDGAQAPRVIVGVDGSPSSVQALREAVRIGTRMGASVQALTCWNRSTNYDNPYGPEDEAQIKYAQKVLDQTVEDAFGVAWPENLTTRLVQGSTRESLIEESRDAMMLVVGRRGFGGFRGLLMGSVSSACAAHAHCPVLVVHGGSDTGESDIGDSDD